jgi:serine/threonine-protein kinase HipA
MGRPSKSRALGIWANGKHVGHWIIPTTGPMELRYDPAWIASPEGRPLSLSLPINLDGRPLKGDHVGFYFDNLLPDRDAIRRRIEARFDARSTEPFDLLEAVGHDCVGAVQLLPDGEEPQGVFEIHVEPLNDEQVERRLLVSAGSLGLTRAADEDDDFRISIAGAQEKTALTWHEGRWCRPLGATPTTHIFKLPIGVVGYGQMDMSTSVENEWLCARILAAYGLPIARCEMARFGSTKALVVERFDRRLHSSGQYWLRLIQEDFCQATGTPPSRKYESEGGPSLDTIARLLQGSAAREADIAMLLRAELLFWMLAATDGHAKNFSLHLLPEGEYRLTPLYDVLSAWPISGSGRGKIHPKKLKLAMAVRGKNKHYALTEIQRRHFNMAARQCGHGADMEALIADLVAKTPTVIDAVERELPEGFPEGLFESVARGLREQAARIESMPPS